VREQRLKEGDEIDIEDDGGALILRQESNSREKSVEVEITQEYKKNVGYLLYQLYRHGYDKIVVHASKETIRLIEQKVENQFMELVVLKKSEKSCTIGMVSQPSADSYEALLRKMFFITIESFDIVGRAMKTNNVGELKDIEFLTLKYRRYDNYCRRYVYTSTTRSNAYEYSALFSFMMVIQTDIRKIALKLTKNSKVDLALWKQTRDYFEQIYTSYLKQDINGLYNANEGVQKLLEKHWKVQPKGEFLFTHYCLLLLRMEYSMVVPMLGQFLDPGS
jgi:hypothetical protein